MLKLYKFDSDPTKYWETWDNGDGSHTVHWGTLGDRGESKVIQKSFFRTPESIIQKEIDTLMADGYRPLEEDDERRLMIEFAVAGHGETHDLEKRHRLEDRMNETLGWTGLGICDGGSMGSGTMEVCCLVADYEIAKSAIEADLLNTEFADYSRIYDEEGNDLHSPEAEDKAE
jgi:hypothetical protein